jgi:hypothetical protein
VGARRDDCSRLPRRPGDLDTYAVVDRQPNEGTVPRIEEAHATIAREDGVDWDAWYVLADDSRRSEIPRHAFRPGRRDTSWAIHRAHWLAGRYVHLYGREPGVIVPAPTWAELEVDLRRELEHLERHVAEGDNDPFEATYAIFNGSRILHAVETGNVVISKRSAGAWSLEHLPGRWHAAILPLAVHTTARRPPGMPRCFAPQWLPSSRWSGNGCRLSRSPLGTRSPAGRDIDWSGSRSLSR